MSEDEIPKINLGCMVLLALVFMLGAEAWWPLSIMLGLCAIAEAICLIGAKK